MQLSKSSCSEGNYSGKNVLGVKAQETIGLEEISWGSNCPEDNCPGRNYSEAIDKVGTSPGGNWPREKS